MHPNLAIVMILMLAFPRFVLADGCKFDRRGRTVPEREQRALVEWQDGIETLHVAALSDETTDGSVWIIPVRAPAKSVRAEPVEQFPVVPYYETLADRAIDHLKNWIAAIGMLNSGGLCCPCFVSGCDDSSAVPKNGAVEVARVEKLGMIVTVITAESRSAIEQYLDAQGVNRSGADLSSLAQYIGTSDFAFVCGWIAKTGRPAEATGLKLVFPSPTIWFPLLPTRAYSNGIETVVYTRGFVKPAPGCNLPQLKCEYIFGTVQDSDLRGSFRKPMALRVRAKSHEPLTRVTLTSDPQQWDRDLELIPGTTPVGTVSNALIGWFGNLGILWPGLLGALLGLAIPQLSVSKSNRRAVDYAAGALIGAAIALTIWASLVVFFAWRQARFSARPRNPWQILVVPIFAITHWAICVGICLVLLNWIAANS